MLLSGGTINIAGHPTGNKALIDDITGGWIVYSGGIANLPGASAAMYTGPGPYVTSWTGGQIGINAAGGIPDTNYAATVGVTGSGGAGLRGLKVGELIAGGSGGDYGLVGTNVRFSSTTAMYTYNVSAASSAVSFDGGAIGFLTASSGTAGAALTYSTWMFLSNAGLLSHYNTTDMTALQAAAVDIRGGLSVTKKAIFGDLIRISAGTAGTPAIIFDASPTTGIYRAAADQIGWSIAGSERLRLTSTGLRVFGELQDSGGSNVLIDGNRHIRLRSYTMATLPSASPAGQEIYCSNTVAGGDDLVSDGTSWFSARAQRLRMTVAEARAVPGVATLQGLGLNMATLVGTPTLVNPASGDFTKFPRVKLVTGATANDRAGVAGSVPGWCLASGFRFVARFGVEVTQANLRMFVGMAPDTTDWGNTTPSARLNIVGLSSQSGQNFFMRHNDGSGTATAVGDTGLAQASGGPMLELAMWCAPGGSTVEYMVSRLDTGAVLVRGTLSTDLPVSTTMLTPYVWVHNGGNAAVAELAISSIRIEAYEVNP